MTTTARRQTLDEDLIHRKLVQYHRDRAPHIREELVALLGPLVESLAWRQAANGAGENRDDLVSEGFIGLLSAIDNFDPQRGVKFTTYATHLIVGQMKHYLRDKTRIIREPAWLQDVHHRLARATEELSARHRRPPTSAELAEALNLTEEGLAEIIAHKQVFNVVPLHSAAAEEDEETGGAMDLEKIKSARYETFRLPIEDRILVDCLMTRCKEIEQKVITLFFYQDMTQTEIARSLSISCNYVGHLLRSALTKMRKAMQTDEIREIQLRRLSAYGDGLEPEGPVVDRVTGLYTADHFRLRLLEEVNRATYFRRSLGLCVLRFPGIEKLSARDAEAVMELLGDAIRHDIRRADIAGRTAEWEIAIMFPYTGSSAEIAAERLADLARQALEKKPAGRGVRITCATAVSLCDEPSTESLLALAGAA
jgi:RNA polymerase sigma-B factor